MKMLSIFLRLKHLQLSASVPVINSVFTLLHHLRKPLLDVRKSKKGQTKMFTVLLPNILSRKIVRLLILVNGDYFYSLYLKAGQILGWKQYMP